MPGARKMPGSLEFSNFLQRALLVFRKLFWLAVKESFELRYTTVRLSSIGFD